jgi:hypothetical protein
MNPPNLGGFFIFYLNGDNEIFQQPYEFKTKAMKE